MIFALDKSMLIMLVHADEFHLRPPRRLYVLLSVNRLLKGAYANGIWYLVVKSV